MQRGRWFTLLLTFAVSVAHAQEKPVDIPISPGENSPYRLVGKLHVPLGTVLTVQGVNVENRAKSVESGRNFRVQRINGWSTQEHIQLPLSDHYEFLAKKNAEGESTFPQLIEGKSYEFQAFESGAFVGLPNEARGDILVQVSGHYFRHTLEAFNGRRIGEIVFTPADFVDRSATLGGRAVSLENKAYIQSTDETVLLGKSDPETWLLMVDPNAPWPADISGKLVEGTGIIRKTDERDRYILENSATRLTRLEDQVGRRVSLRGMAWDKGIWWLKYRGTDLHVENMEKLPNWSQNRGGSLVLIEGVLEEAVLPPLGIKFIRGDKTPQKSFIVRQASWKPIDALQSFELE